MKTKGDFDQKHKMEAGSNVKDRKNRRSESEKAANEKAINKICRHLEILPNGHTRNLFSPYGFKALASSRLLTPK